MNTWVISADLLFVVNAVVVGWLVGWLVGWCATTVCCEGGVKGKPYPPETTGRWFGGGAEVDEFIR